MMLLTKSVDSKAESWSKQIQVAKINYFKLGSTLEMTDADDHLDAGKWVKTLN